LTLIFGEAIVDLPIELGIVSLFPEGFFLPINIGGPPAREDNPTLYLSFKQ